MGGFQATPSAEVSFDKDRGGPQWVKAASVHSSGEGH